MTKQHKLWCREGLYISNDPQDGYEACTCDEYNELNPAYLKKMVDEYVRDPHNHESCNYKQRNDIYSKTCSCDLHAHLDQFIQWLKDRHLRSVR